MVDNQPSEVSLIGSPIQPAPSNLPSNATQETTQLVPLGNIEKAIIESKTVDETKNIHDLISGFEETCRLHGATNQELNPVIQKRLDCERKGGSQLREIERLPGGRPQKNSDGHQRSFYQETLAINNIKPAKAQVWQIESWVPYDDYLAYINQSIAEDKELTSAGLITIGKPIKALNDFPPEEQEQILKRAKELASKGTARTQKRDGRPEDYVPNVPKAIQEHKRKKQTEKIVLQTNEFNSDGCFYRVYNHTSEDMKEIDDESAHMVITSPPYNNNAQYDGYDDSLPHDEYERLLSRVLVQCFDKLIKGGRIAWVVPAVISEKRFAVDIFPRLYEQAGFVLREVIVWQKSENQIPEGTAWGSWCSPSNPSLRAVIEFIFIGHKGNAKLDGDVATITPDEFRTWTTNLWSISPLARPEHPAVFPQTLADRLIKLYTFAGQTIIDPFSGYGTSALACKANKRNFIGYEISEKYYKETLAKCLS